MKSIIIFAIPLLFALLSNALASKDDTLGRVRSGSRYEPGSSSSLVVPKQLSIVREVDSIDEEDDNNDYDGESSDDFRSTRSHLSDASVGSNKLSDQLGLERNSKPKEKKRFKLGCLLRSPTSCFRGSATKNHRINPTISNEIAPQSNVGSRVDPESPRTGRFGMASSNYEAGDDGDTKVFGWPLALYESYPEILQLHLLERKIRRLESMLGGRVSHDSDWLGSLFRYRKIVESLQSKLNALTKRSITSDAMKAFEHIETLVEDFRDFCNLHKSTFTKALLSSKQDPKDLNIYQEFVRGYSMVLYYCEVTVRYKNPPLWCQGFVGDRSIVDYLRQKKLLNSFMD